MSSQDFIPLEVEILPSQDAPLFDVPFTNDNTIRVYTQVDNGNYSLIERSKEMFYTLIQKSFILQKNQ